jgi:hypothetical protein
LADLFSGQPTLAVIDDAPEAASQRKNAKEVLRNIEENTTRCPTR